MRFEKLGQSTINVSKICFGGWQANGWASSNPVNFKNALTTAIEQGINFIDTAPVYGQGISEKLIAEVIGNFDRTKIVIATKFLHSHSSKEKLITALEKSLKDLNTDYIDLYQQHWPSSRTSWEETMEVLLALKQEGKIRAIGVCNWTEPEWEKCKSLVGIDTLQPCYSLLWRQIEKSVLKLAVCNKIAVLPYSPLAQGLLCSTVFPTVLPKDHRAKGVLFSPERKEAIQKVLDLVKQLADKHQATMAQISLAWLLAQPGITSVIVGASKREQMVENIKALEVKLSEEDINALSEISAPLSSDLEPHSTLWGWHPG